MVSNSQWLELTCPAKLNLLLHITGRREDGYHNLQTLFQLLDFGDSLAIKLRQDYKVNLLNPIPGVAYSDNLIIKAIRAFQRNSNLEAGCDIKLNKVLPMGGGIGGGSSNAATALIIYNHLLGKPLDTEQLAEVGLSLGADVPVFIKGHSAWAEGVGEKLKPVTLPSKWFVVIHPGEHISTAAIFNHPDLTRNTPIITIRTALAEGGHNDCEVIVRSLYPEVDLALKWLNQFAPSMLTGTGACVFASFDSKAEAESVLTQIPSSNWNGFIGKSANVSITHRELSQL